MGKTELCPSYLVRITMEKRSDLIDPIPGSHGHRKMEYHRQTESKKRSSRLDQQDGCRGSLFKNKDLSHWPRTLPANWTGLHGGASGRHIELPISPPENPLRSPPLPGKHCPAIFPDQLQMLDERIYTLSSHFLLDSP